MVWVEGGTFQREVEIRPEKTKEFRTVTVSGFFLCRYPVTQCLWREVMGQEPDELHFTGSNRPVEGVSWLDCGRFLEAINAQTGKTYRLPTEAEWEYAALGGSYGLTTLFSGSADLDEVGWFEENSFEETHASVLRLPNTLGLFDLSGNVFEWCFDWYWAYPPHDVVDPQGSTFGGNKVYRGGCFRTHAYGVRIPARNLSAQDARYPTLGFRLAHTGSRPI